MPDERRVVLIPDLPAQQLLTADDHLHDIVRELQLMVIGAEHRDGMMEVPTRILRLLDTLLPRFARLRDEMRHQAQAALDAGRDRFELVLDLPAGAVGLGDQFLRLLDEAEGYAERDLLLTEAAPPELARFRRDLVEEIVRQLR